MRRGHPTGIGGWRNVNPRGFRPRGGGTPSFRPTRPYALFETPRYQPPRPYKDYNVRQGPVEDHNRTDRYSHDHDKIKFRVDNRQNVQNRHQDRGHQRHNYYPRVRQPASNTTYGETSHYYENTSINSMGDVDHRQSYVHPNQEHQHNVSPWVNTPTDNKKHYDDKNQNYKHDVNESNKMLLVDYTGHRPPASDHYDGNPGPALDNSNTFSRSVDDTVNIVRKRLLSRNESQQSSCDDQNQEKDKDERVKPELCPSVQQEQPMKKKIQRQRQNIQLNCAKIKTKIVHQLFKMDKDKIHKLMDNPNSSTKFEYAISSLITESQNSYNRHLRSVAEKSLCSSSTEFMQNDNNTIYEDTFMKQMQCILDPQDTVLLEDIKPMVMAELSKVLQLDNFLPDDQTIYQSRDEQPNYDEYNSYDKHSHSTIYYPEENCGHIEQNVSQVTHDVCIQSEILTSDNEINKSYEYNKEMQYNDTKPLYERRPIKKSNSYSEERRISSERRHSRRSLDNKTMEEKISNEAQVPLFDTNAEQFSDEEDPFAELDKQYHVAVDHNFIESDYPVSQPSSSKSPSVKSDASNKFNTPEKQIYDIRTDDNSQQTTAASKSQMAERNTCRATQSKLDKDIDSQLLNIAKSPIKLSLGSYKNSNEEHQNFKHLENLVKQELIDSCGVSEEKETYMNVVAEFKDNDLDKIIKQENIPECKDNNDINDKSENHTSITKSALSSNSRKRSIDQRPSHRKEKRKKSESCQMETNKQILNKNIIINLSDCAANSSEKCDAPKSIFNLFFSKDDSNKEVSKDNKSSDLDKGYSDKYVKRKETPKKIKETEIKRKHNSNSFSNSAVSPKMNNVTNINIQTPSKAESKAKLKTIDMFLQQPKKMTLHQAHRNTVLMPSIHNKSEENKPKLSLSTTNKLLKRHVATQVIKKYQTKDTQTIQTRKIMRAIQTDPVTYLKTEITSTDPFERMKEIDFEIQLLLQEKFKLYNSMESKDSCPSTMQNLGMTVLNFDATKDNDTTTSTAFSGDAIAEDFTNIPVEELEQIAFGTVDDDAPVTPKLERKSKRQKILQQDRKSSVSPITATKRNTRKSKTPNISLIEQIITDDRPLEDIISLDDLEAPIVKTKKKPQKQTQKKKVNKKTKSVTSLNIKDIKLKPCSVVIIRENIEKYLQSIPEEVILDEPLPTNTEILIPEPEIVEMDKNVVEEEKDIVEEVVTDMQFDMLDVSEDIVIGDNCEDKLVEEKDADDRIEVPITEEIILDNSQSSADDGLADTIHNSNMCRTFDYSGDENLRRDSVLVTGNADAVLAIECIESNFIAACLDGNVYYFSGDGQLISTLRGSNLAVTCLTIVKEKYGTTVYTGSLDSRIRYYDLETGLEKGPECNVLSPIQTMDRAWDTVFVGTRTGFVLQFECKNNMLIPVSTVKFSEQSILALRAMKEGPRKVLLVAARSENVTIKDAQTGLLLRILNGPKMTVYTLLYEDGKVYCGTSSHQIHVFDYTSGGHVGTHEGGKGAVCLRSAGGLLFAGCYDGCVYVYREGECRPFAQLRGPSLMLLSLAIVGSKIIAGYKDRSLYIWKIPLSILQEMIL